MSTLTCPASLPQASDSIERIPFLLRIPVTREYLATVVGKGIHEDDENWLKARPIFEEALYDSVVAMVHMFVARYSVSSHVEIEDLEQECFKRIFKKLSMYDASKSQFTTWASRVCVNLLNGNYRKSKKHQDRFVAVDMSTLRSPLKGDNENERHDMLQAIEDLFELYPQWVLFLSALFGGRPSEKGFDMPMKLSVRKACRATGTPFDKASPFYIQVVRPFFTERFC